MIKKEKRKTVAERSEGICASLLIQGAKTLEKRAYFLRFVLKYNKMAPLLGASKTAFWNLVKQDYQKYFAHNKGRPGKLPGSALGITTVHLIQNLKSFPVFKQHFRNNGFFCNIWVIPIS